LKNWAKRLDGTLLDQAEYDKIRIGLWRDYYNLLGFSDQANFAWASTCHRAQGATLDVVIIDIRDMTRDMKWMEIGVDEQASALYTAATRAKTQVVIME
jgi:hypothetical protein